MFGQLNTACATSSPTGAQRHAETAIPIASAKNAKKPAPDQEPDVLVSPLYRRIVNAQFRIGGTANAAALIAFASQSAAPSAVPSPFHETSIT